MLDSLFSYTYPLFPAHHPTQLRKKMATAAYLSFARYLSYMNT